MIHTAMQPEKEQMHTHTKQGLLHFQPVRVNDCLTGLLFCLQCFDAVGWAAGRASGL